MLSCSASSRSSHSSCRGPWKLRLLDELQHVRGLRLPGLLGPAGGFELLGGVLADRLEHREARLAVGVVGRDGEAAPYQGVERVEVAAADGLDRLEPRAAREHGEAGEEVLLLGLEQLVAPVDRGPQRLLACRSVGGAADEEGEPLVEALEDGLRRQQPDAGGCQLDRERQAVESGADRGDDLRRLGVDREARLDGAGPGLEQLRRVARRERLERVLLLAGDAEAARLVRTSRERPAAAANLASSGEAAGTRCSTLSSSRRSSASRSRCSTSSSGERAPLSRSPSAWAIVEATSDGSRSGASATKWTPSSKPGAARAASSSARRVLPVPPGPVIVSSGLPGPPIRAARSASSRPRPTRAVGGRGRPSGHASTAAAGGGARVGSPASAAVAAAASSRACWKRSPGSLARPCWRTGSRAASAGSLLGQRRRGLLDVGPDGGDVGVAREGGGAGEQLVEEAGERVDVGGGGGLAALDRLGREVVDGAEQLAGLGQPGRLGGGGLGDAEVGQVGVLAVLLCHQEHVGGLDVSVDEPLGVGGVERGGDLGDESDGTGGLERPLARQ